MTQATFGVFDWIDAVEEFCRCNPVSSQAHSLPHTDHTAIQLTRAPYR